jgi:Ca2+-binding RTX toxin-like protein
MSWKYAVSTETQINLGTTDSAFVGQYVTLGGGIIGTGSNHHVIIDGTVAGDFTVRLGDDDPDSGEHLEISETGKVFSGSANAVTIEGYSSSFENAGEIRAAGVAVLFNVNHDADSSGFVNSGLIHGDIYGFFTTGSQDVHLKNTGTIEGTASCYRDFGNHADIIVNKGTMAGGVSLGLGSDRYDGRLGHVIDLLLGGDGDDTIYGGSENNTFNGENGLDKLYGARGADMLTGGADADIFIFRKVDESTVSAKGRDTINDFTQAQFDQIDLHSIDANTHGTGNQAFEFIGHQGFHHEAGELRYAASGGDTFVYADVNGDAKSDFALKLVGDVALTAGDFIL